MFVLRISRQQFNLMFIALLFLATLLLGWFIPIDLVTKIQVEIALLFVLLLVAYELQDQQLGSSGWVQWVSILAVGVIVVGLSLRLEPIWVASMLLFIQGKFADASERLSNHPHANLILFIGLAIVFLAVVGLIRLGLLKAFVTTIRTPDCKQ